ncbi:hypothetical protein VKT23_006271 [Stygiomarasmius scandens]|uniref:T6SS Phospholipase effector Tle1-like catalytic domain-containing protein n=1 Tax=Marasmiellus scandens TaxID=2682957 RepID=A0ABR1JNN3_9AGAR
MADRRASTSSFQDLQRTLTAPPEYSFQVDSNDFNFDGDSDTDALNDVIPEPSESRSRTLVLCFDGTGDQFDDDNSNVVQFFSMLKKDDWRQQLVYYQSGIGTYNIPQVARPWMAKLQRVVDMMVGMHLSAHVMTGYEFIMQNYQSGDKICLFGFSRGAYTARALAGMIHKVGLLPRYNHQQVPFAYKMYSREDEQGWKQASAFKKAFSIDVDIEFLGVWDTVSSVGFIPRRLPFTTSNTSVHYFRHALALDEHRARFVPNFWHRTTKKEAVLGVGRGVMPKVRTWGKKGRKRAHTVEHGGWHGGEATLVEGDVKGNANGKGKDKASGEDEVGGTGIGAEADTSTKKKKKVDLHLADATPMMREMEALYNEINGSHGSDVQEVWFAGCHCDVGGGAVPNETRNSLSRIPLRWMIRQTFLANTGIMFHREMLRDVGLDPATLWPVVHPRPTAVRSLDHSSALRAAGAASVSESQIPTQSQSSSSRTDGVHRTRLRSIFLQNFTSEEEEDYKDALSGINDELESVKAWWILELLPQRVKYQNEKDEWVERVAWGNLGRARHLPKKHGVKVHRTVKIRMEAEAGLLSENQNAIAKAKGKGKSIDTDKLTKYVPKPKWDFEPIWVD